MKEKITIELGEKEYSKLIQQAGLYHMPLEKFIVVAALEGCTQELPIQEDFIRCTIDLATRLLMTRDKAVQWLHSPNEQLHNETPFYAIKQGDGQVVLEILEYHLRRCS